MDEHQRISAQEEAGEGSLKVGDVVELTATATYYDGRIIPAWVKKEQWIVKRIDGDRVVIDQNMSGTNAIKSPVNSKYLNKA